MEVVTKTEIAVVHTPRPIEFKFIRHTTEDMMAVKLAPSKSLIRLINEPSLAYIDPLPTAKLKSAFAHYSALAAANGSTPETKNYIDRLRWKLHRFLLRHKVII